MSTYSWFWNDAALLVKISSFVKFSEEHVRIKNRLKSS